MQSIKTEFAVNLAVHTDTIRQTARQQSGHYYQYDPQLEAAENRGECPRCRMFSMVNIIFVQHVRHSRFCLECGYAK